MRNEATVTCNDKVPDVNNCNPLITPCLFDIVVDPCENDNLAEKYPNIVKFMLSKLKDYNITAVPPGNLPIDPKGDPIFFDHTWTNFGDFI